MKTINTLLLGMMLMTYSLSTHAQVSVNVNLGTPPAWGPVGYNSAHYYYLPDVQSYYDVRVREFIYLNNDKWYRSKSKPAQYRNYNLYTAYKVVLTDYKGNSPYTYFNTHKTRYFKGYKGKPQKNIGTPRKNNSNGYNSSKNYKNEQGNHENYKKDKGNNGNGRGKK